MGAACFFSPVSLLGHSPPLPEGIPHASQRNPCSLTLPSCSQNAKARLKVTQKELKDLQWEHEVLEQRFSKVRAAVGLGIPLPSPNPVASAEGWARAISRGCLGCA